ncbi:MAG: DNA replication/repair protein RecF [Rhodospirillales bacterium]|nr:DNA replication/repair protein RecF [Rhodospirillales bacterium]
MQNGEVAGKLAVTRLTLSDFRCYARARLEVDGRSVVLVGPNGAGKTNLLEAISFLMPGRGLRRARLAEIGRREAGDENPDCLPWAVAATLAQGGHQVEIGTGVEPDPTGAGREKRTVRIEGSTEKSQAALGRLLSAQWLTPGMDRLFQEGAGGRRRFLDRLIYGLDPEHGGPVSAYEKSLRERSRLLRDGCKDLVWLDGVEDSMARHGIAVAARRLEAVRHLHEASAAAAGPFPGAHLAMSGELEDWLGSGPALAAEDRMRAALAGSREWDAMAGGASVGPHKSDFAVSHAQNGRQAAFCSTGEQKALMIAIVLAQAQLQAERRGHAPLLLLDEILAHLDAERRHALFERIFTLGAQAWMTGTDQDVFTSLGRNVQYFTIDQGTISPA